MSRLHQQVTWTASYRLALLVYAANLREPCAKSLG